MGALQNSFTAGKSTLAYVGGIILLYGIILGRTICGWICPLPVICDYSSAPSGSVMRSSPLLWASGFFMVSNRLER